MDKESMEQKRSRSTSENKREILLYVVAATLVPNIFFLNLFERNQSEVVVSLGMVLFAALTFMTMSALLFVLLRFLVRSWEGALLTIIICWAVFWLFGAIVDFLYSSIGITRFRYVFVLLFGLLSIVILFLRLKGIPFYKGRVIFNWISFAIGLLFVFNAFPLLVNNSDAFLDLFSRDGGTNEEMPIERVFAVSEESSRPDVYWLMPDGMINFVDFETYFGDSQEEFKTFLEERGFVINKEARFIGNHSAFALPSLMSPALYDHMLKPIARQMEGIACREERQNIIGMGLNLFEFHQIASDWELFRAFMQVGYRAVHIASQDLSTYRVMGYYYRTSLTPDDRVYRLPLAVFEDESIRKRLRQEITELIRLLSLDTPLMIFFVEPERWQSIPSHAEAVSQLMEGGSGLFHEEEIYRRLVDSLYVSRPKIAYVSLYFTHAKMWYLQEPEMEYPEVAPGPMRTYLYPLAHETAVQTLMNLIDTILEDNPNAVIVIQADHGLHAEVTHEALREGGYTDEDIIRLNHSTMSAVRIPSAFGGLEEPLAPLNIARELVNRFVGINYELLPD